MQYPLISEYLAAIREAKDNLDTLSHLVPVLDKYGEPYRSSGAFAVVFKMKDEQTGKCYALKCFTEDQEGRAEAYRQIAEEFEFVDSPYITSVKYLEKEIFVDSNCENEEFPVLLMDWIEGETMETYIADNYTDTHAMAMLYYRFCKMAVWLRSQSFAHGDIKPDNIDDTIDDFALASIALSLKAISLDPSLLKTYGASDRLLFSAADYLDLSKSKTFAALQGLLADEEARTLMSMFLLASAQKNLSMCSFRLFGVQKPKEEEVQKPKGKEVKKTKDKGVQKPKEKKVQKSKEEEVWSTNVTKKDLENAVEDEFGVKYSKDWKRLLKAPSGLNGKYSIRKGVKVIGNSAFSFCRTLASINIPTGVTNIGATAFLWCDSLTKINIPKSVTNIGDGAFSYCKSLTKINIPNSVTNIGDRTFKNCESLTSINIPDGVTNIENSAFESCNSLVKINIPDSVTNIEFGAFYACESLTNINIPDSVTTIGNWVFRGCKNILPKIKSDIKKRFGKKVFE